MLEQTIIQKIEEACTPHYTAINQTVEVNQKKVLEAFQAEQIGDFHFSSSDGYGYDDSGRDGLESIYANVFGGEEALVRPQIVSGTHAIATSLYSLLHPGDELLYITGSPYDTLEEVIGKRGDSAGSFKDYQISYDEVPLLGDGVIDYDGIRAKMNEKPKVVGIQRSKGYEDRPSFTIAEIEKMV